MHAHKHCIDGNTKSQTIEITGLKALETIFRYCLTHNKCSTNDHCYHAKLIYTTFFHVY